MAFLAFTLAKHYIFVHVNNRIEGASIARPRKDPEDKKSKWITFYMSEDKQERPNAVAAHLGIEKTRVVAKSLDTWNRMLENLEQYHFC